MLCKPHSNHKEQTSSSCTKDKEKGIKVYQFLKSYQITRKTTEKKKGIKKLQSEKQFIKWQKFLLIKNYFEFKWIKFFHQEHRVAEWIRKRISNNTLPT